ncbi:MAG: endonuclease/exonuclease/phosphatase family protein [Myxococcota bacterium]
MRVATLNIWNKSGPWQKRTALIRTQIEALNPDLLALQEVLELEGPKTTLNQADELRGELHRVYAGAYDLSTGWIGAGHQLHFGNALLSRWPVEIASVHELPGADRSDQRRGVLHAVVQAPHGPIDVFVTHLNWKLDEGWIREEQVKFIAARVAEEAPDDGRFPPILLGDLNAEPQSDEIRYLLGFTRLGETKSVRFADAWHYRQGPGFTFDASRNPYAAKVNEPPRRIDYLLVRGPDAKGRGTPSNVKLCFHEPEDGVFPSDHFGVVADLQT